MRRLAAIWRHQKRNDKPADRKGSGLRDTGHEVRRGLQDENLQRALDASGIERTHHQKVRPMPHARMRGFVPNRTAASYSAIESIARALSIKDVVRLTSLSRAHIYLLISEGKFPAPAKIGRRSIWHGQEVAAWIEARFAARPTALPSSPAAHRERPAASSARSRTART